MVFSSLTFICIFLPASFALACIARKTAVSNVCLALASIVFYAYGEPIYVLLMLASTLVNWFFGLLLARPSKTAVSAFSAKGTPEANKKLLSPNQALTSNRALTSNQALEPNQPPKSNPGFRSNQDFKPKAFLLAFAIITNLIFLCIFKYADMLIASVNSLFSLAIPSPNIALPIGISFYTFQAMSYVIDVYRGDVSSQRNFMKMLLYISFFPQLIAGPIVKYHDIEEQISKRHISLDGAAIGFRRFCAGLAKKVLIADVFASIADALFEASPDLINMPLAWLAAVAFVLQIYFDFSGYSDMAIGLARAFGFNYRENFNYPYVSTSIKEFWRRWHISLSTWFKEYLYIPLGGNRKGRLRAGLNKIVVFLCCGLWHGAAWTFVVWGLIHGFFLLLEEYVPIKRLPRPLGWLYTMLVVCVAFVVFRADSFDQAFLFISQMFTGINFSTAASALVWEQLTPLTFVTFVCAIVTMFPVWPSIKTYVARLNRSCVLEITSYVLALAALLLCVMSIAGGGYNAFIYFRF